MRNPLRAKGYNILDSTYIRASGGRLKGQPQLKLGGNKTKFCSTWHGLLFTFENKRNFVFLLHNDYYVAYVNRRTRLRLLRTNLWLHNIIKRISVLLIICDVF